MGWVNPRYLRRRVHLVVTKISHLLCGRACLPLCLKNKFHPFKKFFTSARLTPNTNSLEKRTRWVSRGINTAFYTHSHPLTDFAKLHLGRVTHLWLLRGNNDTCHSAGRIQLDILCGVSFLVVGTWGAEQPAINGGGSWRLHIKTKGRRTAGSNLHTCHALQKKAAWPCRKTVVHLETQ